MPKNIDDVIKSIPVERRSIRNIPIPEKRRRTDFVDSIAPASAFGKSKEGHPIYIAKRSTDIVPPGSNDIVHIHRRTTDVAPVINEESEQQVVQERRHKNRRTGGDRRNTKRNILIGLVVFFILAALALLSLSSGATVTYTPKSTPLSFNKDSYTAFKDGGPGQLLFSVIKLSGDKSVEAPASGEENVSNKASGKAIVYNNTGADPQRLIRNTRFETPEGKIYRILTDITIPGKKGTEPGSLEVTLYADQPGADYNMGLSDFTVPGLKGDPRFTTIYARSKTPMTGGLVGVSKKVGAEDLVKAKSNIESALKAQFLVEAKAQVPDDFILFPNLVQISYTDQPQSNPTASGVTVTEHADFSGLMFKKSDLANYLASKKVSDISMLPVNIPDLENLDAVFTSTTGADLLKADQVNIDFTGSVTAVSSISQTTLKTDLAGASKGSLGEILKKYPNILTASAVVRPFWKTSFPTDISKISLVQTPQP